MQVHDLYLRSETEAEMRAALGAAGFELPDVLGPADCVERQLPSGGAWSLLWLGVLYTPPVYDGEVMIEPPVPKPGWHANLRFVDAEAPDLGTLVCDPPPVTPEFVWA